MAQKRRSGNQDSSGRTGARARLRVERLDARDSKPATALQRQIESANPAEMYVRKLARFFNAAKIDALRAMLRVRDDNAAAIAHNVDTGSDRQRLAALTAFVAHAGMPYPLADAVNRWHADVLDEALAEQERQCAREALAAVGKGLTSVTSGRPATFDPDTLADRRARQTAESKALARLKRRFNKNLSHFPRMGALREALGDSSDGLSEGEAWGRGLPKESRMRVRARFVKWEAMGRRIK
jgi:hypothetical protein